MENEIWKKVPGFPLYSVSNIGRVKKENYNKTGQERIFLPKPSGRGYIIIHVGGKKFLSLHRMIAFTFFGIPPGDEYQVNHIDDGSKIKLWHGVRAVAEHLGYDHSAIVKCCKGKQNYHKGFRWEYAK